MIDEDLLTNALHDVANAFEVPVDGADRVAAEAAAAVASPSVLPLPGFLHHHGRARVALVAAAIAIVVAGISVPLLRGESNPGPFRSIEKTTQPLAPNTVANGAGLPSVSGQIVTTSGQTATGTSVTAAGTSNSGTGFNGSSASDSLKIESTGSIALTVQGAKVTPAFNKLSELATRDGGFVNSTNAHVGTRVSGKFSYGTIVLQVPQRSFSLLVAQVQRVGHATSVSSNSTDVTSQYVDLSARISADKSSRQQYLAIMKRATTISGILAVETQLNSIQSQIEQLQGQLNVLNNATTYGTLSVTVSEAGQHSLVVHPRTGFSKAWHDSVRGFVSGFQWLIRIAGPALFAILLLGALSFLGRFAWRANRRRRI